MRNYGLLLLAAILGSASLFFIYRRSVNQLKLNHESTLRLFLVNQQVDSDLEKDIFALRASLQDNYDSLTLNQDKLAQSCEDLKGNVVEIYHRVSQELDAAIENYCELVDMKIADVELFKSRNAVFRNSIFYIHNQIHAIQGSGVGSQKFDMDKRNLVEAALSYGYDSTSEAKQHLEESFARFMKQSRNVGSPLALHVHQILQIKELLDQSAVAANSAETDIALIRARIAYFRKYDEAEVKAQSYGRVLFLLTVLLLGFGIYALVLILRAAARLSHANLVLEERVRERTKELRASEETILLQQNSLVASAKTSALGEMAGQIAHEINTPLGAIVLTAQGLLKKMKKEEIADSKEITQKMEFILQVTSKLTRIIGSMRKMAGHGASELITEVRVKDLVEDTLLLCEGRFKKSGIEFKLQMLVGEGAKLQCRPNEVSQVLVNLLNNAHDAIKDCSEKWVHLEIEKVGETIVFCVSDSGPGISETNKAKLFTPNFTTKSLDAGTGFGLSISRKLIERHNGRLDFDNSKQRTTFRFELPMEQTESLIKSAVGT